MRLNQNEEDLFNELDKIEFDFKLDDEINRLNKNEKEKLLNAIENIDDDNNAVDDVNNNEPNKNI
ncbi:MAG: hypothetical protein EPN82_13920 [Bacteroidetes bacterium]|nr:MAG: hypothetical protein EPN82_13920 [Bacteroidota bacterium]